MHGSRILCIELSSCCIADVPILHLIVTPFPSVWHKASDNANAINYDDTEDINKILRVFVAEYLQLRFPRIQQSY